MPSETKRPAPQDTRDPATENATPAATTKITPLAPGAQIADLVNRWVEARAAWTAATARPGGEDFCSPECRAGWAEILRLEADILAAPIRSPADAAAVIRWCLADTIECADGALHREQLRRVVLWLEAAGGTA